MPEHLKMRNLAVAMVLCLSATGSAWAQSQGHDQTRYQEQLLKLSNVLGQLHHLRGSCVSSERQLWRDNMMELVRLEAPPAARKNAMVEEFNAAFEASKRHYPACNREATRAAIQRADEGGRLSKAIARSVAR